LPPASIEFGEDEWTQEVDRLDPRSSARVQAQKARKEIEAGRKQLDWQRCEPDGPGGIKLPGCSKLYIPLDALGASAAPFGFVFRLVQNPNGSLAWNMIAFGERHPANPQTRSVYERAHMRLHGRYP
jgi:hypothetical protein